MKKTWKHAVRDLLDMGDCLGVVLSNGEIALVDYRDRSVVEGWNWSARPANNGTYAFGAGDYLHVLIMGGPADHKNGQPLDCRRSNLRRATRAQNARNRRIGSANKSGYKGVCFRKDRGTWLASIRSGGTYIKIGTFRDKESAARAYDQKARELFGEFAVLNFPDVEALI